MKIAIAGAGMSGAYLFRRLVNDGFKDIDLFDVKKTNACGSRPCAWGYAPASESRRLIAKVIDPGQFELQNPKELSIDGIKIRSDMLTINKPALIKAMIGDTELKQGPVDLAKYDRVIDATGVSRAYLPAIKDDLIAECTQYRMRSEKDIGCWLRTSSVGYEWSFPLGGEEFHIGFGNLRADVGSYRPPKELDGQEIAGKVRCKCQSTVRLTSPYYSQPFVKDGKVVGIGESIGVVAPLAADGNLHAMSCGEILLANWDDLESYSKKILREYDWMRKERKALDKIMAGRMPSLFDAITMKKHCNRMGVELKSTHVLQYFSKMMEK
jgi:flavin-dependent dehydrogenase